MQREGLTVPKDWAQGALFVHQELTAMCARLRVPRSAAAEPASVFLAESFAKPQTS
jgi:hypothetical protein